VLHFEGNQQPDPGCLTHFEFVPEALHTRFFGLVITETGVVGLRDAEMAGIPQLPSTLLGEDGFLTEGSRGEIWLRQLVHSQLYVVGVFAVSFLNSLVLILVLAQVLGTGYYAGHRNKDEEAEEGSDHMVRMLRNLFLTFFVAEHGLKLYAFRSMIKRLEPQQMVFTVLGLGRGPTRNGFYGIIAFVALVIDYIAEARWDPWIITIGKTFEMGFVMCRLLKRRGFF